MVDGLGDAGVSVVLVHRGVGGLTWAGAGEEGLMFADFMAFNGMLLAPICFGWFLKPTWSSVHCNPDGPAVDFPC